MRRVFKLTPIFWFRQETNLCPQATMQDGSPEIPRIQKVLDFTYQNIGGMVWGPHLSRVHHCFMSGEKKEPDTACWTIFWDVMPDWVQDKTLFLDAMPKWVQEYYDTAETVALIAIGCLSVAVVYCIINCMSRHDKRFRTGKDGNDPSSDFADFRSVTSRFYFAQKHEEKKKASRDTGAPPKLKNTDPDSEITRHPPTGLKADVVAETTNKQVAYVNQKKPADAMRQWRARGIQRLKAREARDAAPVVVD